MPEKEAGSRDPAPFCTSLLAPLIGHTEGALLSLSSSPRGRVSDKPQPYIDVTNAIPRECGT